MASASEWCEEFFRKLVMQAKSHSPLLVWERRTPLQMGIYVTFSKGNLHPALLVAQTVKRLSTMLETRVQSLGREDPLEKEIAIHSSTIAWKIPWTEELHGLVSYSPWGHKESDTTERLHFHSNPTPSTEHRT